MSRMCENVNAQNITVISHERHGVSNHLQFDCLFNRLFRLTSQNKWKLYMTGLCERIYLSPMDSHNNDVIMDSMASQITSLTIVYSAVYSGADQRKNQSSTSLAFVRGIHREPVNSPHKWPVTRKMFPFDDVIMPSQRANTVEIIFMQWLNQIHIFHTYYIKLLRYVFKILVSWAMAFRCFFSLN